MIAILVFHKKVFRMPVSGKWKFRVDQFCSDTELLNWIWTKTSLLNDCSGSILHWLFYDVKFTHWLYISCVLTYALRDDITSSQDTDFNLKPRPPIYIASHRCTKIRPYTNLSTINNIVLCCAAFILWLVNKLDIRIFILKCDVIRFVSMTSSGSIAAPSCRISQSKGRYHTRVWLHSQSL